MTLTALLLFIVLSSLIFSSSFYIYKELTGLRDLAEHNGDVTYKFELSDVIRVSRWVIIYCAILIAGLGFAALVIAARSPIR